MSVVKRMAWGLLNRHLMVGLAGAWFAMSCAGTTTDPDAETDSKDTELEDTEVVETDLSHTDPDTEVEPVVACELGTGEMTFEDLEDGDDLVVVHGPQNGWHVYGSVRCVGVVVPDSLDPRLEGQPFVRMVVLDELGALMGGYEGLPRPMAQDGEEALLIGDIVILFTTTYEEVLDRQVSFELELTDGEGVTYVERLGVRLVAEPEPPVDTDEVPGG
jgi:hypothetical protein